MLDSDTRLVFTPGAVLQKQASYVQVLANRGLAAWTWATNIFVEASLPEMATLF